MPEQNTPSENPMNEEAADLNRKSSQTATGWIEQLKAIAQNEVRASSTKLPEIVVARLPDVSGMSALEMQQAMSAPQTGVQQYNAPQHDAPQHNAVDCTAETVVDSIIHDVMAGEAEARKTTAHEYFALDVAAQNHTVQPRNISPDIASEVAREIEQEFTHGLEHQAVHGTASEQAASESAFVTQAHTADVDTISGLAAKLAAAEAATLESIRSPAVSDLSASPDTWQHDPADRDGDRTAKEPKKKQDADDLAIDQLVEAIVARFPATAPCVLMFTGSEDNPHCEETCAQVALRLAQRNTGKVLLVDSDTDCGKLSRAGGGDNEDGLTTWLTRDVDWKNLITRRSQIGLEFMPVGHKPVKYWKSAQEKILPLIAEFKKEYQYVCVAAGEAHSKSTSLWAATADGTYLVVSMEFSSQSVALSASHYLKDMGARVVGCVVTESAI